MTKAAKRPKQRGAFRNKYLAAFIVAMAFFITGYGQIESRYSQISGTGFKYKRTVDDSVKIIPLSTSPHIPYRMGGIRYNITDSCVELWTGTQWIKDNRATQLTDTSFIIGNDTIRIVGSGIGGGGGLSLIKSAGSAYRLVLPPDSVRSINIAGTWLFADTTSNRTQLRMGVDPQVGYGINIAPVTDVLSIDTTGAFSLVPQERLRDTAAALRAAIGTGGGGVDELTELTDVTIATPKNGQVTYYDSITSKWKNSLPSAYNPVWFGLVGDSSTDNTAAFRKMLETVPNGAIIEFPGGDFLFTDTILINKSITIRGTGKESIAPFYTIVNSPHKGGTNLYLNSATKNFFHIKSSGTNKNPVVAFRDLSLINTAATTPTDGAGIFINDNFVSHSIENITVRRFYNNIEIVSGHFININFCNIVAPIQDGIVLGNNIEPDGGGCTIQNNKIISGTHNTSQARGVYLKGGGAVIITGNYFNAQATLDTATQFVYDIYGDFIDGPTSEINLTLNNFANYKTSAIRLENSNSVLLPVLKISNSLITPLTGSEGVEAIYIKKFTNITISDITAQAYAYYAAYPVIKLDSVTNITIGSINKLGFTQDYTQTNSSGIKTIIKDDDNVLTTTSSIVASGALTIKDPAIQIWKDATPSFATSVGMRVPGGGNENDMIFSTYAGGGWSERMRVLNSTGALVVNATTTSGTEKLAVGGAISLLTGVGTNRDLKIHPGHLGIDNFGAITFAPNTGTNATSFVGVSPKGTGFASSNRASISVFNTDFLADDVNYEISGFRAAGTQFVLGTGASGTGTERPLMMAAGWMSDGSTNANQLYLHTNGNVLLNTDTDNSSGAKLQVNGDATVSDDAYDATSWNGNNEVPTKNALRDKIETLGGGNTIYTADDAITGNRTVTAGNNDLTFLTLDQLRFNMNTMVQAKNDGTIPYTNTIAGTGNIWKMAYTPVAGTYSKGDGLQIDTNNNVIIGAGTTVPFTPLYATGNSLFAIGIQNNGGAYYHIGTAITSLTLGLDNHIVLVNATSGNITITLPAASTVQSAGVGIEYKFKRMDNSGNTITIQRSGSDTIDGGTSFTLTAQYEVKSVMAVSNTVWAIF